MRPTRAEWIHVVGAVAATVFVVAVMATHVAESPGVAGAAFAAAPLVMILSTARLGGDHFWRLVLWLGWILLAVQVVTAVVVLVTGGEWFFVFPVFRHSGGFH